MTELRITRGGDIRLFIDGDELYGVIDFKAASKKEGYEIQEYLSGEPYCVVNTREKYEISLSVLSLFRSGEAEDGFTLSVLDGGVCYDYENCTVIGCERDITAGKNVVDKYTLTAKSMRKRVIPNA